LTTRVHSDGRHDDGPSTFREALSRQDLRQLDAIASVIGPRQDCGPAGPHVANAFDDGMDLGVGC